ncbi:GNAT family N-acetyltransferase [Nocardia sp. CDC160]|uniref:GNAT family N-acetyltransferase n=1 Tax=Nocardia sp. CDC160 TaxID=3112166 RepID=UPI002DB5A602|nr:GNAT family N-acetyltransferase [Nocardia sp. CDC160]MEC3919258.1 GNAT family N-acetyltransferase [Nocardia sp. CDC160]
MAEVDDAALLADLGAASYRSHFSSVWTPQGLDDYIASHYDIDCIRRDIEGSSTRYFLAHVGDDPAGFAKVTSGRPIPLTDDVGTELEKVYLLPEFTGGGRGSALIKEAIGFAAACGEKTVWLTVLKENQAGRRLYERLGFTVAVELPFATDLREIGFWMMTRSIG